MANRDFGSTRPGRAFDPDAMSGWGTRYGNWQFSTGVQQQLLPGMAVDVAYWRTSFTNIAAVENRAVTPADYDQYSIRAPVDPRLPGGGGYVLSGLYDVRPTKFGIADEYVSLARNYGNQSHTFNGVDLTVNARPRPGLLVQGGLSAERESTNNCDIVARIPSAAIEGGPIVNRGDSGTRGSSVPQQFCDAPGTFQTQVKLLGSFVVPVIDVQMSASLQNLPGPEISANYTVPNAVVASSLGRSLASGASNVVVSIVEPRTLYGDRMNQLDLRFAKILRFGDSRATVGVDIYNALNSSAVLSLDGSFDNWLRPDEILNARFAKLVVQFDF
jgi:hypothetical protein